MGFGGPPEMEDPGPNDVLDMMRGPGIGRRPGMRGPPGMDAPFGMGDTMQRFGPGMGGRFGGGMRGPGMGGPPMGHPGFMPPDVMAGGFGGPSREERMLRRAEQRQMQRQEQDMMGALFGDLRSQMGGGRFQAHYMDGPDPFGARRSGPPMDIMHDGLPFGMHDGPHVVMPGGRPPFMGAGGPKFDPRMEGDTRGGMMGRGRPRGMMPRRW